MDSISERSLRATFGHWLQVITEHLFFVILRACEFIQFSSFVKEVKWFLVAEDELLAYGYIVCIFVFIEGLNCLKSFASYEPEGIGFMVGSGLVG